MSFDFIELNENLFSEAYNLRYTYEIKIDFTFPGKNVQQLSVTGAIIERLKFQISTT